jgi:hypothetical protein
MSELLKCGGVKKLPPFLQQMVADAELNIVVNRLAERKKSIREYIVVNTDEPYIDEIIDVLKRHNAWGDGDTNV